MGQNKGFIVMTNHLLPNMVPKRLGFIIIKFHLRPLFLDLRDRLWE